ncbi:recombinase family protein [uncultured Sulfitobacter sp.]|uniref:recombinase family protein n=1 Tax=uncultured Sulfitobacter sp. TaxID=191468 RepID=UPI00345D4A7A
MEARMQNGYWVHNAPVGYKYVEIKGRGKVLFPDAPLDEVVKEAFEGYANGRFRTVAEVTRFLGTIPEFPRSKRTGKITQQRVVDMLTHPLYTGHICSEHYGISWSKAQHEPLISLETLERVQARREGKAYAPRRKNLGNEFVLRGIAACACCDAPFRSSFTKGNGGLYAYYLCQTKGCEAYGKSIKRDTIEGDVGELIKTLEPTENLKAVAIAMFQRVWDMRHEQAKSLQADAKRKLREMDKRVETLVGHIMNAQSAAVVPVYEGEIITLERRKAILAEQIQRQTQPKGTFQEKLEPALTFLSNPFKLWDTGHVELRRTVLKLAFIDRIKYCRKEGARTTKIAFPFKALGALSASNLEIGARGRGSPIHLFQRLR